MPFPAPPFFHRLEQHGDTTALIQDDGERIAYGLLADNADKVAARMGRNRKRLILAVMSNTIGSLIGYLAALRAGHTVMMVDAGLNDALLTNLIATYHPELLWRPARPGETVADATYGYLLESCAKGDHPPPFPDLALLLPTSGSTGNPKMVRLATSALHANAEAISDYLALDSDQRPLCNLPSHYSYGLSVINSHLAVGATLLLTDHSMVDRAFWNLFHEYQATSLAGVPYNYDMLSRMRFTNGKKHPPSLATLTQAGGKLAKERVVEFAHFAANHSMRFFVMYGQTEATARISYLDPARALDKPTSVGQAIPGGKIHLLDPDGKVMENPHTEGEILYEGPNVMMGYAESREDLTAGDLFQGRLPTGDIGYIDGEGDLFITGRLKRFIKIHGSRTSLDDIEAALRANGIDAVCGGWDNALCIAMTDPDAAANAGKLLSHRFGIHKSIVTCRHFATLPRNNTGKVLYAELFREEMWS